VQAQLANEVQLSFGAQSAFDAFIKSGKLRSLAVTTAKRQDALPGLPTIKESLGIDFDTDIWYGLMAPAKTPAAIVRKISEDLQKVLADPDTQNRLRNAGVVPDYMNAQDMGRLIQRDVARWREVSQRIKLTLD
jgi:tripartite-type tricarboxylate transporter receptor subunit TctC